MKRVLLSIGCDHYKSLTPLGGAERDARSIYNALTSESHASYNGESSILLLSPTMSEVRACIRRALFELGQIDTFTFFFAGHGGVKSGGYYLCLTDTDSRMLSATAVGISDLFSQINESQPRQTNIILDACQGGGVVTDLHSLLKPELIGGSQTPSITIFASSASDQYSGDTEEGGIGTIQIMKCITGHQVVQTARPTLDLLEVGKAASTLMPLEATQTPVLWGLNLYGEARFCANPHYYGGTPVVVPALPQFAPGSRQGNAIRSMAPAIWKEFFSIDHDFDPKRLLNQLQPTLDVLAPEPADVAAFIRGISDTFATKAAESADSFRKAELLATCASALLPLSASRTCIDEAMLNLAHESIEAAQGALTELLERVQENKYGILGRTGGFGELYYLPLRVTRILGWIGACHHVLGWMEDAGRFDEQGCKRLVRFILDHYAPSIATMSDSQAPFLLSFLTFCNARGWNQEAETVLGLTYNSIVSSHNKITQPNINSDKVLEYLLRRTDNDFSDASDILAQPTETLSVILMMAREFHMEDVIDHDLFMLDHATFNVFIPDNHRDFAKHTIRNGVNHSFQIGHGVWRVTDFTDDWDKICGPTLLKDGSLSCPATKCSALLSSLIFPDRCPWFLARRSI